MTNPTEQRQARFITSRIGRDGYPAFTIAYNINTHGTGKRGDRTRNMKLNFIVVDIENYLLSQWRRVVREQPIEFHYM